MATHRANGPTRVTDADPLEQPSLPLTTNSRLMEPEGHGPQGDPASAGAKSLPESRPETSSGSMSPTGYCDGLLAAPCDCPWEETGSGLRTVRRTHHKPGCSSFPLTTADRESVQADLEQQRDLLARHSNTEPLTGMVAGWSKRYWAYVREIARLERMLEDG